MKEIKKIFKQILIGLGSCHKLKIVHRNLKPDNILISSNGEIKISDFGSSKSIDQNNLSTPHIVSRYYRALKLILGETNYDEKIDIFSAGCILAELFMLEPLFPGKTEGMQLFEYIIILGLPKNYLKRFNLPKKLYCKLRAIKLEKIEDFSSLLNKNKYFSDKDIKNTENLILDMIQFEPEKKPSTDICMNYEFFNQ